MDIIEILKALILGIVEGITEWLPISSTGHMILVDEFLKLNVSEEFKSMFLVVIQLGAILAVVVLYFKSLYRLMCRIKNCTGKRYTHNVAQDNSFVCSRRNRWRVFDDQLEAVFYNWQTVSAALIIFGILFIIIEKRNRGREPKINSINDITYKTAIIIGMFQLIAAVFPGTSRSGATIVGALLIGVSRSIAAEYTFSLQCP